MRQACIKLLIYDKYDIQIIKRKSYKMVVEFCIVSGFNSSDPNTTSFFLFFFILLYFMRDSNHSIVSRRKKEKVSDIEDACQLVWTKSHLASLSNLRAARHLDTSDSCSWVFVVLYQNGSRSLSDFHIHGVETTPTLFKLWPVVCHSGPVCAFCNTLPWDWQNVALMPFLYRV